MQYGLVSVKPLEAVALTSTAEQGPRCMHPAGQPMPVSPLPFRAGPFVPAHASVPRKSNASSTCLVQDSQWFLTASRNYQARLQGLRIYCKPCNHCRGARL